MFGLFGKKNKKKQEEGAQDATPDVSNMSDAKQQLFAQLQAKREELGPETIAKMQKAAKAQKMREQLRKDIDTDEKKRDRIIDEIRLHMQDKE